MIVFDLLPVVAAFSGGIIVHAIAVAIGDERRKAQAQAMNLSLALQPANDVSYFD